MTPQKDPRELIGAYVLGACSAEEEAEVRAHIKASPAFRAEVESFDDVRRALLEVPDPDLQPTAALKRSVMAQVQAEASLFAAAGPAERAAMTDERPAARGAVATAHADVAPSRGAGAPTESPRRNAFLEALRHPARATALAAVIVALIVGGIVVGGGGGGGSREINGNPTARAGADATVRLIADSNDNRLQLHGFPSAGAGKQYQVWLRTGDANPRPTKVLFDVDAKGNATAKIPGSLKNVDDVLVTSEPKGGSKVPTSQPVLHVQI